MKVRAGVREARGLFVLYSYISYECVCVRAGFRVDAWQKSSLVFIRRSSQRSRLYPRLSLPGKENTCRRKPLCVTLASVSVLRIPPLAPPN